MALATRPKPKTYHKKRQAQHHRHSKLYMKTYYPYLPMLGIVAFGVFVDKSWAYSGASIEALDPHLAVSRLGALTGNYSLSLYAAVMALAAAAFIVFVITHWVRIQRYLSRGEKWAVKHPWFEGSLVLVFTASAVLLRL